MYDWLNQQFIGSVASYASHVEIAEEYKRWEQQHPGKSMFEAKNAQGHMSPRERTTARCTTLCSSRTLPGQWWRSSSSCSAASVIRLAWPKRWLKRPRKWSTSPGEIVRALAQRRDLDPDGAHAVEQVLAEQAALDHLRSIP